MLKLDFQWASNDWILRKIGHFIGFFILALLASNFGKYKSAFYLCIIYAALTEILQLFFFRGGRIYDVINDSLGVLLAYFAVSSCSVKAPGINETLILLFQPIQIIQNKKKNIDTFCIVLYNNYDTIGISSDCSGPIGGNSNECYRRYLSF